MVYRQDDVRYRLSATATHPRGLPPEGSYCVDLVHVRVLWVNVRIFEG